MVYLTTQIYRTSSNNYNYLYSLVTQIEKLKNIILPGTLPNDKSLLHQHNSFKINNKVMEIIDISWENFQNVFKTNLKSYAYQTDTIDFNAF